MAKSETAAATPPGEEVTLAQVLARMAEIQAENQRLQRESNQTQRAQLKQTAPRSNQAGPRISVFNPRGEKDFPMPDLKCEVHMPFQQKPGLHGMDREEVTLMNMVEPGDYQIELNDGSFATLCIMGRKNHATGAIESMSWSGRIDPDTGHPTPFFTESNKQQFPPLRNILRQVVGEELAAAVMPIVKERRLVAAGELEISKGE